MFAGRAVRIMIHAGRLCLVGTGSAQCSVYSSGKQIVIEYHLIIIAGMPTLHALRDSLDDVILTPC